MLLPVSLLLDELLLPLSKPELVAGSQLALAPPPPKSPPPPLRIGSASGVVLDSLVWLLPLKSEAKSKVVARSAPVSVDAAGLGVAAAGWLYARRSGGAGAGIGRGGTCPA
jgi:hypothetical protein